MPRRSERSTRLTRATGASAPLSARQMNASAASKSGARGRAGASRSSASAMRLSRVSERSGGDNLQSLFAFVGAVWHDCDPSSSGHRVAGINLIGALRASGYDLRIARTGPRADYCERSISSSPIAPVQRCFRLLPKTETFGLANAGSANPPTATAVNSGRCSACQKTVPPHCGQKWKVTSLPLSPRRAKCLATPPAKGDVPCRKPRLNAENASGSALAFQAVAHRNAGRDRPRT